MTLPLAPNASSFEGCATACCGDWNCISFAYTPGGALGPLSGTWLNHDSLRGTSLLTLSQQGSALAAVSEDPAAAFWSTAEGMLAPDNRTLFLVFNHDSANNRTGNVSADGSTITLQEREFGVGLKFVPTVLDGGRISLKVAPEVSEISRESVTVGGQGNASSVLPAFTTRRVSTTVQLQDGQSLVIGGLIRNSSSGSSNAFPILGELPILGALFRSSQFASDLTELVVVVRASLVQATEAAPALPTDKVSTPTRQEFFLERRLQGRTDPAEAGRPHAK